MTNVLLLLLDEHIAVDRKGGQVTGEGVGTFPDILVVVHDVDEAKRPIDYRHSMSSISAVDNAPELIALVAMHLDQLPLSDLNGVRARQCSEPAVLEVQRVVRNLMLERRPVKGTEVNKVSFLWNGAHQQEHAERTFKGKPIFRLKFEIARLLVMVFVPALFTVWDKPSPRAGFAVATVRDETGAIMVVLSE